MTLTTIDNIRQELRVDDQGRGWVSISGAARLAGVTQPALSMSFDRYKKNSSKLARFLTQQGFNPISFSETGVPDVALVFVLEYYAFHASRTGQESKDVALLNFRSVSAVGARPLIRQACGWNEQPEALDSSALVSINTDGLEIIIDEKTGEAFASIRAAARMLNVNESTLRTGKGARLLSTKTAEIHTAGGLQGARLFSAEALFDLALEYKPALAKAMAKAGATIYLQRLVGWKAPVAEQKELSRLELLELALTAEKEKLALESKLELAQPKADKYDRFLDTEGLTTVGEFAKELGIKGLGQNNMFKKLREMGFIIQNSTMPYQKWVDRGYFIVRSVETPIGSIAQTHITKKGVEMLLSNLT